MPAAQQSLLLKPEEVKDLESYTKALEGATKWDFSKPVSTMTAEHTMTPEVNTDLTRILKASVPFDIFFPPPPQWGDWI